MNFAKKSKFPVAGGPDTVVSPLLHAMFRGMAYTWYSTGRYVSLYSCIAAVQHGQSWFGIQLNLLRQILLT